MSAAEAQASALVRAHPSPIEPPFDASNRKLTPEEGQKKRHRTYSDGSYRISKRSPEAARTELIVTSALRYAEDLKKKEGRTQQAPTIPPSKRDRRVHLRC